LPLIPTLVDIGVDILNPIQPVYQMDPEYLMGLNTQLIFHGGLDVQDLLLNKTPIEVKQHVRHYYEVLGVNRYIMAPANTIQPMTPAENVIAAFQSMR
jgi:uroporphyrinogen decarboxylase